jgi:hypothetical protein
MPPPRRRLSRAPDTCPNCGADLGPNVRACPECGSDEQTGWSEQAQQDALGLPDADFDYDDFVRREFAPDRIKPRGIGWFWWAVAAVVLVAFLALVVR